jgi:hypothetical protein
MYAYFASFLAEKEYMPVASHVRQKFDDRFKGDTSFYRGYGIVMVLCGRRAVCFLRKKDRILNGDQRPKVVRPPMPAVQTKQVCGATVPRGANVFRAALRSQLPSRGRNTPDARMSGKKTGQ